MTTPSNGAVDSLVATGPGRKGLKGWIATRLGLIGAVAVIGVSAFLGMKCTDRTWQAQLSGATRSAAIVLPARVERLSLDLHQSTRGDLKWLIAGRPEGVSGAWEFAAVHGEVPAGAEFGGATTCGDGRLSAPTATEDGVAVCCELATRAGENLRRLVMSRCARASGGPSPSPVALPDHVSTAVRVYLMPMLKESDLVTVPETLQVTAASWEVWTSKETRRVDSDTCAAARAKGKREPKCDFVDAVLSRPAIVDVADPQVLIRRWLEFAETFVLPALVWSMLIADGILAGLLCFMVGAWAIGKLPLSRAEAGAKHNPLALPPHMDHVGRGLRAALEWLEVTGPALGFLLTVAALLAAFDPRIFVERDSVRFSRAISLAMAATAAGLVMRILAFSADRVFRAVLSLRADVLGFLWIEADADQADSKMSAGAKPSAAATASPPSLPASQALQAQDAIGTERQELKHGEKAVAQPQAPTGRDGGEP